MLKKFARNFVKTLSIILGVFLSLFIALVILLTVTEYKPDDRQEIPIYHYGPADHSDEIVYVGDTLSLLTWNTGYASLGKSADFFMDGGTQVNTATRAEVESNVHSMSYAINSLDPDIVFLQEVDADSTRSHHIDESSLFISNFSKSKAGGVDTSFAYNYKTLYVPYPIPPIGEVNAGLLTQTSKRISQSERISLPCPFKWPSSTANLKRCLLVSRIGLLDADGTDSGKELVLINLHLEAYDSGEGKIAQTKLLDSILEEEYAKGNYVIAGGDFNQSFSSLDTSMYPMQEGTWHPGVLDVEEFSDHWQFISDNVIPSCRSLDQPYAGADHDSFQYYCVDGFIVSDNITVDDAHTVDLGYENSDHNPVLMNVTLN